MDDAVFARFLVARGRLPQAQVQGLLQELPPGIRLAQGLVQARLLSVEETHQLWAEAMALSASAAGSLAVAQASAPESDQTCVVIPAGPADLHSHPAALVSHPLPTAPGPPSESDKTYLVTPAGPADLRAHPGAPAPVPSESDGTFVVTPAGPGDVPGYQTGPRVSSDGLPALGSLVANRYRLEAELGRGGMGAVFRATDLTHQRQVALKLILPRLADAVSLERFKREAQLAARVDREGGVVRVFDFGVHGEPQAPYCAMELIEGRDLAEVFRAEGLLEIPRLLGLVASIADTLALCHQEGIVHRDLKPANVLVTPEDITKLADFGLARDGNLERLTQTGEVLGTPSYMAPEQANQSSEVDGRSDLYSLGAILYCGLTGRPPFQGAVHTVIRDVLLREPPPPSKLRPDLAPDLEAICLQAMAKDPDARYPDAKSFADDLRRARDGAPVLARPQGAWARFASRYRRGVGRTRTKLHAGVLLSLTLLLGGGFVAFRALALRRVAAYQAWAEAELKPYAYGLGNSPSFTPQDLAHWEQRLAWTGPFTREGAAASETLRAHTLLLAFAAGESLPTGDPSDPAGRVARAAIQLQRAVAADAKGSSRGAAYREQALGWVQTKHLTTADPETLRAGARLRLRLELYDPGKDPEERLILAEARIRDQPALAQEARDAAVLALSQGLSKLLASHESEPARALRLRELAGACGPEVLRLGVEKGLASGAKAWTSGFGKGSPKHRPDWLTVLGSVCGHSDQAIRPGPIYTAAFTEATSGKDVVASIRLAALIADGVDPAFQPPDHLYERVQERVAASLSFDLELVLFSLRTLPGGSTGKFIPPSLRTAFERFPDPAGPTASFEGRYRRFADYFLKLTKQPRYRRSRALRLLRLVALRRAGLHKDPRMTPVYVGLAREVVSGKAGQTTLVADLAESWQGFALLELSDGLCELAKQCDSASHDRLLTPEARALQATRRDEAVAEAMSAARAAEGKVKPQYAGAPFEKQTGLTRDPVKRIATWARAEASLRKDLAAAEQAGLYTTIHYEEALAVVLRRRARELFNLRRYDPARVNAEDAARFARKSSGLKVNQDLDGALAVLASIARAEGDLPLAERVLAERMDVGLQTDTFAFIATQVALDLGRREEAIRRIRLGVKQNPRNDALQDLLQQLEKRSE